MGLSNVIAIEGAERGILANTVLPFGYSRMMTGTIGELPEDSELLRAIDPALVVPLVTFLASRSCQVSHHNFSACARRYARVFVGLAEGWLAEPDSLPTADDVDAHFAEVAATAPFTVPGSIFDEVADIVAGLGITT